MQKYLFSVICGFRIPVSGFRGFRVALKIARLDDAFWEVFLTASKPSRRPITAATRKEKEKKERRKKIPTLIGQKVYWLINTVSNSLKILNTQLPFRWSDNYRFPLCVKFLELTYKDYLAVINHMNHVRPQFWSPSHPLKHLVIFCIPRQHYHMKNHCKSQKHLWCCDQYSNLSDLFCLIWHKFE